MKMSQAGRVQYSRGFNSLLGCSTVSETVSKKGESVLKNSGPILRNYFLRPLGELLFYE